MKIAHNKNLTYAEIPGGNFGPGGLRELDTEKMLLTSLRRSNKQTLVLNLKTGIGDKNAYIRAKNIDGEKDLDLLENRLKDFINKSYNEILYTDY